MKFDLIFNTDALVIPGAVISKLPDAGEKELKFLLSFISAPEIRSNKAISNDVSEQILDRISAALGYSRSDIDLAVAFWRGAGIIRISENSSENAAQPLHDSIQENQTDPETNDVAPIETGSKILIPADSAPEYTGEELERIFDTDTGLRGLIDECQNIAGKVFNPHEIAKIVALSDYLRLEHEHILLLFSYCCERGKTSVAYIQKTAYNLYNEGIDSLTAFEDYIKRKEAQNELDNKLRKLFGFGNRTITPRERKFFDTWFGEYQITFEMVERAYQITVDNTDKLSLPYLNKILSNWHTSGYKSIDDVDSALEEYRKMKASNETGSSESNSEGSFDTDKFFELALQRSIELMKENENNQ